MEQTVQKLDKIICKIELLLEENLQLKDQVNQLKKKLKDVNTENEQLISKYQESDQELQRLKLVKHVDVSSEERNTDEK